MSSPATPEQRAKVKGCDRYRKKEDENGSRYTITSSFYLVFALVFSIDCFGHFIQEKTPNCCRKYVWYQQLIRLKLDFSRIIPDAPNTFLVFS